MGGGDYNRNFLYPVGGVEVVEMVEMMEIVPRNKYTRHLFFPPGFSESSNYKSSHSTLFIKNWSREGGLLQSPQVVGHHLLFLPLSGQV